MEDNNSKKISKFTILFTLIYLFFEITFNLGLFDFINSKNTEIDVFNHLQTLGRILSSLGISLFFINLIKNINWKPKLILVLILGGVFYVVQGMVFDHIINSLSNERKIEAYSLGTYRNLYLNNDNQKDFNNVFTSKNTVYNQSINSMIGIFLYNNEINKSVNDYVSNFFSFSMSINKDEFGEIYDKLNSVKHNQQSDELWKKYYIESKKYNNYQGFFKNEYHDKFVKAIGVEPNLSQEEFLNYLKSKSTAQYKVEDIVIVPENKAIGLKPLTIKDIPNNLSKDQWVNYISNYINKSVSSMTFNAKNIDNLPHSRDIISSVVIVPIAIILSLLSIILNFSVLLINKKLKVAWISVILIFFIYSLFVNNYYKLPLLANGFINMEANYTKLLDFYKSRLHSTFINDEKPNYDNILVIKKPTIPNMNTNYSELDAKIKQFGDNTKEFDTGNSGQQDIKIDDAKLKDQGYYGEVDKKNPYQ